MHGEVPSTQSPRGGSIGATLEGGMLPLANAALAAVANVQKLCASAGDPPPEALAAAAAQAALLMDACANVAYDLAVAEHVAAEVRFGGRLVN